MRNSRPFDAQIPGMSDESVIPGTCCSGESLVPRGSVRVFRRAPDPALSRRVARPCDPTAPGLGRLSYGQSPRSSLTSFRTPGESPSKSVLFVGDVRGRLGRLAADVDTRINLRTVVVKHRDEYRNANQDNELLEWRRKTAKADLGAVQQLATLPQLTGL